jgi:hypothetical protein
MTRLNDAHGPAQSPHSQPERVLRQEDRLHLKIDTVVIAHTLVIVLPAHEIPQRKNELGPFL